MKDGHIILPAVSAPQGNTNRAILAVAHITSIELSTKAHGQPATIVTIMTVSGDTFGLEFADASRANTFVMKLSAALGPAIIY